MRPLSGLALSLLSSAALAQDETIRVSNAATGAAADGFSRDAVISADGRFVAFTSLADDLVPGDTNDLDDVFLLDTSTGAIELVSVAPSGSQFAFPSFQASISADGSRVAFATYTRIGFDPYAGYFWDQSEIYVRDRATGTTIVASVDAAGRVGNRNCYDARLSADGMRVAFDSPSDNLVAADQNGFTDSFLRDLAAGTTTLVSVKQDGSQTDASSFASVLSADGLHVAFLSYAQNLPGAALGSGGKGIYVKDLDTGVVERVDVDSSGANQDGLCVMPTAISDDGNLVLFGDAGALLSDDGNGAWDVLLRDRAQGTTERVSVASGDRQLDLSSWSGSLTGDGRWVVFSSVADDAVADDPNGTTADVFVHDRQLGTTTLVSRGTLDEAQLAGAWTAPDWQFPQPSSISSDGTRIVFTCNGPELAPADGNGTPDVFLRIRDLRAASSSHYGAGFPGRNGVIPTMTPTSLPFRDAPLSIDITSSAAFYSVAFVAIGVTQISAPTSLGGTLLVDPLVVVPLPLPPYGVTMSSVVPRDFWANGLTVDLQTLELDPAAAHGVSFSDGLELVLGDV